MSSFSVGIVGLPNSGKSTLFNTLLKRQMALVADYPFTTIEPNTGIVEVPDDDLIALVDLINPEKVVPATVQFIDIAGLVKDAHKGEGLGNQFLGKIREVDAVVHLLRAFENPQVAHYYETIDPKRDKEIVDIELELGGIKKPTLYVNNVSGEIAEGEVLSVNAKTGAGVDQLIQAAYRLLDLITFYTIKGGKEVTAWALRRGETALKASALVHTDIAKGFIKAEVINVQDLLKIAPPAGGQGGWTAAKIAGKIRLEGKDYLLKDKDVIEFKFSL
jgi:hypothetical protein